MKIRWMFAGLALVAMLDVSAAPAGTVPKAEMKKSARPAAQEPQREIPYEELSTFKGQRIIVHTTLGTTRSGKLTKYSQTQIDIAQDGNDAQFTFLREGIKSIGIPIAPEPTQEDSSAKKN